MRIPLLFILPYLALSVTLVQAQVPESIGETGRLSCLIQDDGLGSTSSSLVKLDGEQIFKIVAFKKWLRKLRREIRHWKSRARNAKKASRRKKFKQKREDSKADRKAVIDCQNGIITPPSENEDDQRESILMSCTAFQGNSISSFVLKRIVNGTICSGASTVVRLSLGGSLCSGIHIGIGPGGNSWVLTASHCTDSVSNANQISIQANSSSGEITKGALSFQQNPNWTGELPVIEVFDYALIQVDGVLTGVPSMPPCTSLSALSVGSEQFIAGYGRTLLANGQLGIDGNLRGGAVVIDQLSENTIRATRSGGNLSVSTSCGGDSGGPVTGVENNAYCVAGVVSWGTDRSCSSTGRDDVAYWSNITSADGQNFIATHVGLLTPAT